ncbi:MAG: hypothetical protein KGM15_11970 [Pseudomonadota bacterium]|nr:hypothetical protein [Pseudomonadota bacterium]
MSDRADFAQTGAAVAPDDLDDERLVGLNLTPAEAALAGSMPAVMHAPTYVALHDHGISCAAITGYDAFDALHVEPVCFLPSGRFELARDMRDQTGALLAVIVPCRNDLGFLDDLCAWEISTDKLAWWRGAAALIGESYFAEPWVDDGVRVFATVAEWLRADRRGVVILRSSLARWRLAEHRLIVDDAHFGRKLRDALWLPEPCGFVDTARRAAA